MRKIAIFFLAFLLQTAPGFALQPDEILPDPALETRARSLSAEIRCLVCQNQSIDDSDAELARDLRLIIRERLVAGDSDSEIQAFLVARYGDFVLLRPPFKPVTYILWVAPFLIFAIAGGFLLLRRRTKPTPEEAQLTPEEAERLKNLI